MSMPKGATFKKSTREQRLERMTPKFKQEYNYSSLTSFLSGDPPIGRSALDGWKHIGADHIDEEDRARTQKERYRRKMKK